MKRYTEPLSRVSSLFMIFFLLIQQLGCVNSKVLIASELPSYYPKYLFQIHYKKAVYTLDSVTFANKTLTGKINDEEPLLSKHIVHIYPTSDSVVKINKAMLLSIPFSGIEKIKSTDAAPGKSALLVVSSIALLASIILIIYGITMDIKLDLSI